MMQEGIVAAIVACAFFAVARRYAPKALLQGLQVQLVRLVRFVGFSALAARLETRLEAAGQYAACGSGCGSCGGCGPKAATAAAQEHAVISLQDLRRNASQ